MSIDLIKPNEAPETSECQWIDVREPGEFETENISGTKLHPLSSLETNLGGLDPKRPIMIVCRSGNRAKKAAEELQKKGFAKIQVLEGGILAWKAAGKPLQSGPKNVWAMERQVRFAAGALVFVGTLGGWLIHPYVSMLSAFVSLGLMFSAVTDTCGMALVLARMPWNRARSTRI